MRINSIILSIPPYLSTTWKNIASLHIENLSTSPLLIVMLANGTRIEIPDLDGPILQAIFTAHAKSLEQPQATPPKAPPKSPLAPLGGSQSIMAFELPLKPSFNLENFGALVKHNPDQADTPLLPPELLTKIGSLAGMLGVEDANLLPQPEPHCNCTHCQLARALHGGMENRGEGEEEEIVSDEELRFRSWDIQQTGDQLFTVTDPIDTKEHYSVYLGNPIGCTCGEKNCAHIRAVLQT